MISASAFPSAPLLLQIRTVTDGIIPVNDESLFRV
jgi:hypothetical protein